MIHYQSVRVQLVDEPTYTFGSADNSRRYDTEVDLTDGYRPSSVHGVIVDERPTIDIGSAGGATGIHDHSLLVLDSHVYVAVGPHVVRFTLGCKNLDWSLKTDDATCFGVYYDGEHRALISHGELSICRFSEDGAVFWSSSGADIFTEGVELQPQFIKVVDFNGQIYQLDYQTGQSKAQQAS